jgi:hypothetical protein
MHSKAKVQHKNRGRGYTSKGSYSTDFGEVVQQKKYSPYIEEVHAFRGRVGTKIEAHLMLESFHTTNPEFVARISRQSVQH